MAAVPHDDNDAPLINIASIAQAPANTAASATSASPYAFTWKNSAGNGIAVNHVILQNNSANAATYSFDSSTAIYTLPANSQIYAWDRVATTVYINVTATTPINAANGIVAEGLL